MSIVAYTGPGKELDRALDAVSAAHPYNDYRRYQCMAGGAAQAYLLSSLKQSASTDGAVVATCVEHDTPNAVAVVAPLPWDSAFFGVRMAKLDIVVAQEDVDSSRRIAGELIEGVLRDAKAAGLQHISGRADVEDIGTVHALQP